MWKCLLSWVGNCDSIVGDSVPRHDMKILLFLILALGILALLLDRASLQKRLEATRQELNEVKTRLKQPEGNQASSSPIPPKNPNWFQEHLDNGVTRLDR
jgi:hypothetical protein